MHFIFYKCGQITFLKSCDNNSCFSQQCGSKSTHLFHILAGFWCLRVSSVILIGVMWQLIDILICISLATGGGWVSFYVCWPSEFVLLQFLGNCLIIFSSPPGVQAPPEQTPNVSYYSGCYFWLLRQLLANSNTQ